MCKLLIFLSLLVVIGSASLPKLDKKVNKNRNFLNKFEKTYKIKPYDDFKEDFFKKFEKVSK